MALLLTIAPVATAGADEAFVDRARVVGVTPVPVRLEGSWVDVPCAPSGHLPRVRTYRANITLAQALREDLARTQAHADCRSAPATATAYRVRYEYGGRVYERRMTQDPGGWVDVRVRIRPR
jgi:hypothetical protein